MKKIKYLTIIIITFVCFITKIDAACSDTNLTTFADTMKVEMRTPSYYEDFEDADYYLKVSPIDPLFYLNVYEEENEVPIKIERDLEQNAYVIKSDSHSEEKHYRIDVISNLEVSCYKQILRTIDYTVPPFNMYSRKEECRDNPSLDVCQMYKDTSKLSEEEFNEHIKTSGKINQKEYNKENKSQFQKILEYALFALIPIGVVTTIYIIQIRTVKKKKEAK